MSAGLCACSSPQQQHTNNASSPAAQTQAKPATKSVQTAESPDAFIKQLEAIAASQATSVPHQTDAWKELNTLVLEASRDPSLITKAAWSTSDKPIEFQHADRHNLSLEEAIASIKTAATPLGEAQGDRSTDRPESIRAYTAAKALMLQGDNKGAITELENALDKDPESLALQSELGMLQVRSGRRTTGIATLRRAVDQGLRDANVLRTLAREEGRSGNSDQTLLLLATAMESQTSKDNLFETTLLRTELGERLLEAEYFTAARSVLSDISNVNVDAFAANDLRSQEASDFLRRRPALLMLAGDLYVLQQHWAPATDYYNATMKLSAQPTSQVRLRLAGVALRTGHTAEAALQIVRSLTDNTMPQPWHEEVARALRADSQVSEHLRSAVLSGISSQPPTIRMARVMLAASALNNKDASFLLEHAMIEFGATDFALDRLLDSLNGNALQPASNVEQACNALAQICDAHPDDADLCADAIVRNGRSIQTFHSNFARCADKSTSHALLASSLSMYFNDNAASLAVLDRVQDKSQPDIQVARIRTLAQCGKLDDAKTLATSLTASSTPPLTSASAFLATNQPKEALQALSTNLDIANASSTDARTQISTLVLAADAASALNDQKTARDYLARASQLDPASDDIAARRFTFVTTNEKSLDEQAAAIIIRDLRDVNPNSRWLQQLLAQDLAQRGLERAALSELETLVDDRGEPAASLAMQVDLWLKDKSAISSGIQRLTNQLRARPDSPSLTVALSRLLATTGKPQEAHDLLATQYEKFPLDDFARLREDLLRNQLGKPDEADRLLVERLQKRPMDFATGIEMTQSLFLAGSFQRGTVSLRTLLASHQSLTPDQLKTTSSLLKLLRPASVAKAKSEAQAAALESVELLNARGAITTLEQACDHAELISMVRPTESAAILDAIDHAATIDNRYKPVLISRVAQRLLSLEDPSPGLRLLEELNMRSDPPNEMLGREWIAQTVTRGKIDDVKRMVLNWKDGEHLARSLAQLQLSPDFAGQPIEETRAEFAYFIGNLLSNMGRDALSADVYRFVFEIDPKHAWASNNLGYMILERGGSIEEAAKLLEQAHEGEPDASSIIDSLGWLRYKQGHIEDWTDANGTKREGAITLIEKAMENPDGESNWEMQDHLADALWHRNKGDDRDRAKRCWRAAAALIRDELSFAQLGNRNANDISPLVAEMLERQQTINAKVIATQQGDEPHVADTAIQPVFKPRPEPRRDKVTPEPQGRPVFTP